MSVWQPIETAPKDGTYFIIPSTRPSGLPRFARWVYLTKYKTGWWASDHRKVEFTHWLPLPDAPQGALPK